MKRLLILGSIHLCLLALCPAESRAQDSKDWKLVYENDADGNSVNGSLAELLQDVREGKEVRIGWQSTRRGDDPRWVEHMADASFITIMSGKIIFAQIQGILGQTPDFTKEEVLLKENLSWTMMAGTNGKSDAIMRDMSTSEIKGHNQRARGFKWWVLK